MQFDSILVVCVGNICRSPMAEQVIKWHWPDKSVRSAGVSALVGREISSQSQQQLLTDGLCGNNHRGVQLTKSMVAASDLVLAMEQSQIEAIEQIAPGSRGKVMLLGRWLEQPEIPDPYGRSDEAFNEVYTMIKNAVNRWSNVFG